MGRSEQDTNLIGVVPLAGAAKRIAPLPMSKELFPIGFEMSASDGEPRAKPVCLYLLQQMRAGGVRKAHLILRPGKWDIPSYLEDGARLGMHLSYLIMPHGYGVPYTIDQATPFVGDARIALGYPDIIIEADNVFGRMAEVQIRTDADIVLAAFPMDDPHHWGMIDFDSRKRVHRTTEKPGETHMTHAWAAAIWTANFTRFMHQELVRRRDEVAQAYNAGTRAEIQIADIMQAGIDTGLEVVAEVFRGQVRDVGRPETLLKAVRDYAEPTRMQKDDG